MSVPEITIDGIVFSAVSYKPELNDGRGRIIFSSTVGESKRLNMAYQSKSEGGLWRLCIGGERLVKGADYTQASLIHIQLQEYFNKVIEMTNGKIFGFEFEDTSKKIHSQYCEYVTERFEGVYTKEQHFYDEVNGHLSDIEYYGIEFTKRKIEEYTLEQEFFDKYKRDIPVCGNSAITRDMLNFISDFIERNYKYQSLELIYPGYKYELQEASQISKKEELTEFDGDIYECNFENGKKLCFIKFNVKISEFGGETVLEKSGFAPLTMLPAGATITKFGTYSQYISLGAYICKIFDYQMQCSEENTRGRPMINGYTLDYQGRTVEAKIPKCDVDIYIYIADRYLSLYPYKYFKIHEDGSVHYDEAAAAAAPSDAAPSATPSDAAPAAVVVAEGNASSSGGVTAGGARKKGRRRTHRKKRNLRKRTKRRNV